MVHGASLESKVKVLEFKFNVDLHISFSIQ